MTKEFRFAQKGIILDSSRTKILVHKYSDAKYQSAKLKDKLGLPGGRMEFGESVDEHFLRTRNYTYHNLIFKIYV